MSTIFSNYIIAIDLDDDILVTYEAAKTGSDSLKNGINKMGEMEPSNILDADGIIQRVLCHFEIVLKGHGQY